MKFDVAGYSTLYLIRIGRHHFWHRPFPSLAFFLPTFSTRIIGTLIAVYGIFMTPIGWGAAVAIWIYATAWWFVNDWIKIGTYKVLDMFPHKNTSHKNTYTKLSPYPSRIITKNQPALLQKTHTHHYKKPVRITKKTHAPIARATHAPHYLTT